VGFLAYRNSTIHLLQATSPNLCNSTHITYPTNSLYNYRTTPSQTLFENKLPRDVGCSMNTSVSLYPFYRFVFINPWRALHYLVSKLTRIWQSPIELNTDWQVSLRLAGLNLQSTVQSHYFAVMPCINEHIKHCCACQSTIIRHSVVTD